MPKESFKKDACLYFIPVFLGSNRLSRRLSARVLRKFGIVSYILDRKRTLKDVLSISSRFVKTELGDEPPLLCEQLIAFASAEPSCLPILIPTTPKYKKAVELQRELLEGYFVISSSEELLICSPLANIH